MPQMDQILSGSREFQGPILARSLGQLATSFGGFFATCTAMYMCLAVSLWITLRMSALAVDSVRNTAGYGGRTGFKAAGVFPR